MNKLTVAKIKFNTPSFLLQKINDYEKNIQTEIANKMADKTSELTDSELEHYELTEEDAKICDYMVKALDGANINGLTVQDFLASPQAKVLIPKVIIGKARKAADPIYLASSFFNKIKLKEGNVVQFPSFGVMRAYDVAEGQEIPQETIDWQLHTNSLIKVGKSGVRIQYSEELFKDCGFDMVGMLSSEAGRALARLKEEKAFIEWLGHGHTVFDNDLYRIDPTRYADARTTGVDFNNIPNDTMSIDDYLDLIIALYNNGYTPTDLVMHPLAWPSFVRNGFTGSLTAPFDRETKRQTGSGSVKVGAGAIDGKIPFQFTANISPFAPINKIDKTFSIFCVDRNNVGVLIQKDDIKTESFKDPARDIFNLKFIERYGYGIHNEGNAICSAKNISMAKSFATPERVIVTNMK